MNVVAREEAGFDRTLRAGFDPVGGGVRHRDEGCWAGDVAFTLHDTHGFPVELTEELTATPAWRSTGRASTPPWRRSGSGPGPRAGSRRAGDEAVYRSAAG